MTVILIPAWSWDTQQPVVKVPVALSSEEFFGGGVLRGQIDPHVGAGAIRQVGPKPNRPRWPSLGSFLRGDS
jgi:hypothetical protein